MFLGGEVGKFMVGIGLSWTRFLDCSEMKMQVPSTTLRTGSSTPLRSAQDDTFLGWGEEEEQTTAKTSGVIC